MRNWLKRFFSHSKAEPSESSAFNKELFIFIKIPGAILPLERGDKYEDPLDEELIKHGLGRVTGAGTSLPRVDAEPFCGIDIDATEQDSALVFLREAVVHLQVPMGTQLHYTKNGVKLQDELHPDGWHTEIARDFLHPGFGI